MTRGIRARVQVKSSSDLRRNGPTLDREHLTVRAAYARTGIAAADFSRIRNADLARFTFDRLVGIINRLGARVDVKLKVKPAARTGHPALA